MIKKSYKKPEIVFEHMEFNSTIASACEWQKISDCFDAVEGNDKFDGLVLVPNEIHGGIMTIATSGGCQGYTTEACYHNPSLVSNAIEFYLS